MNIAIFASGTGSNAVKIMEHLGQQEGVNFIVISNKKKAKVLDSAREMDVPAYYFDRDDFYQNGKVLQCLQQHDISLVVLAGFLWLVPDGILSQYPDRVINIHPALLPKYGGKGMFGMHVHQAVVEAGDKMSGITIHYCNMHYDEGRHILQATCDIVPEDTAETVAKKVQQLEHFYFPRVVERFVNKEKAKLVNS